MRTIVFTARGQVAIQEEPCPAESSETMLLRTLYSGLTNGSERNKLLGGNYSRGFPAKVGYQRVSKVVACGKDVMKFKPGDIVYTGTKLGHVEYQTAREDDLIVKLPSGFDLESAALLGVASVALHDVRRAGCGPTDRVLVIGAGLIGIFAAQAVRLMGASVTIADISAVRLAPARALGISTELLAEGLSAMTELRRLGPFSLALECSGADVLGTIIGETWGGGLLSHHGRMVLVAGRDQVVYSFNAAQHKEIAVFHADHFVQSELEEMVRLVASGSVQVRALLRDVVPVTEAPELYRRLIEAPQTLLGTVFRW